MLFNIYLSIEDKILYIVDIFKVVIMFIRFYWDKEIFKFMNINI